MKEYQISTRKNYLKPTDLQAAIEAKLVMSYATAKTQPKYAHMNPTLLMLRQVAKMRVEPLFHMNTTVEEAMNRSEILEEMINGTYPQERFDFMLYLGNEVLKKHISGSYIKPTLNKSVEEFNNQYGGAAIEFISINPKCLEN